MQSFSIIIQGDDDSERLAEVSMDERELKAALPALYHRLRKTWMAVDAEEEGIIDRPEELDMDMDWMGACSDGCHVEPDGRCPHGFYSLGIRMGVI